MLEQSQATTKRDPQRLGAEWREYKQANPDVRIRDAASALAVSEAELVATSVGGAATRLRTDWREIVEAMPSLGKVMCLTRNEHCVHEKVGTFGSIQINAHGGVVLDPDIDLRLFFGRWHHGFAVEEAVESGPRRSLQFFDVDGTAVHKIYLKPESSAEAYAALVSQFAAPDQSPGIAVSAPRPVEVDRPDAAIDVKALRTDWLALKDTHDFFAMLKKHEAGRVQSFRLVGEDLARPMAVTGFARALGLASAESLDVMVFVGSPGCIQIHTGPVKNIKRMGPWQNVLDPGFNLHLREDHIATAWLVRKPTVDGWVTSIEIFNEAGQQIAWMFGKRKPGQPELPEWVALADQAASGAH